MFSGVISVITAVINFGCSLLGYSKDAVTSVLTKVGDVGGFIWFR